MTMDLSKNTHAREEPATNVDSSLLPGTTDREDLAHVIVKHRTAPNEECVSLRDRFPRLYGWLTFTVVTVAFVGLHVGFQIAAEERIDMLHILRWADWAIVIYVWIAMAYAAAAQRFPAGLLLLAMFVLPFRFMTNAQLSHAELVGTGLAVVFLLCAVLIYVRSAAVKGIYVAMILSLLCEPLVLDDWSFRRQLEVPSDEPPVEHEPHVDVFSM